MQAPFFRNGLTSAALVILLLAGMHSSLVMAADAPPLAAKEIVGRCNFKYPGDDQQSKLTIMLRDKDNNEKKNVYRRLWKDYKGAGGVADKMVLYTEFPPDAEGAAFMRWAYVAQSDKIDDQWIYLPTLQKIRRVSIRDPGDSFLGSDLTFADITGRDINADEYKLLRTLKRDNQDVYAVESVPVNPKNALYSKTVSWFAKEGDWDSCVKLQVDFYDKKGEPLKQQVIKWQRVNGAWVWSEVAVKNVQTGHLSLFQVTDVKINVGLRDDLFTERALTISK